MTQKSSYYDRGGKWLIKHEFPHISPSSIPLALFVGHDVLAD